MKLTKRKISILTLALALVMALAAFAGIGFNKAEASGTINATSSDLFSVKDAKIVSETLETGSEPNYYTAFRLSSNSDLKTEHSSVWLRKNLAYHWFDSVKEEVGEEGGEEAKTGETSIPEKREGWFSMEIGFKSVDFEKFVITFESQNYNKLKADKAVSYLMFFPAENGKVYAHVTDDKDDGLDEVKTKTPLSPDKIKIEFTGHSYNEDDFVRGYEAVITSGSDKVEARFENIKGNFSKYTSSSTNPVYPLIFSAVLPESTENDIKEAVILIYSLNGQSFKVSKDDTRITDDTPPVLCLNDDKRYFKQGDEVSFNYTVIDVLRNYPTSTVKYYVLKYDDKTGETDYYKDSLYTEVKNNVRLESDKDAYLPLAEDLAGTVFESYDKKDAVLTADMLVKICVEIADTSSTSSQEKQTVYLDWYVDGDYLVNISDGQNNKVPFMAVAKDKRGATYNYNGIDTENGHKSWDTLVKEYQDKIDELSKNLSAGTSSYLYLPSVETLFSDNISAYGDMKYSVYFYADSKSSNTSLNSNGLNINITKQGSYTFTVYATDAAGNNMYYPDKDGNPVEFGANEIWDMYDDNDGDDSLYYKLPWFTFDVGYTGAYFEKVPGVQTTAYVGTNYSSASFEIGGMSGAYTTNYRLFLFDREKYLNDTSKKSLSYEQFIGEMDGLFDNAETVKYFKEIPQVSESDADYETYKDYAWNNSSTSFTPQDKNGLYYIRAELKDTTYNVDPVTCGLAVIASEEAKSLKGEDDWLENNLTAVILLTVAALAFIGIILLLVIKPKNSEDIDVQFENRKSKKDSKK